MKKQLLAVAALAGTLIAALPGPDPIITVAGAAKAAKLSSEVRASLAPRIEALNAAFQKVVAVQSVSEHAASQERPHEHGTSQQGPQSHASLDGIHEECMRLYHEISQQLDPEQQEAFAAYLHAQLKAAGIDPATVHGGMHPGPGHSPHGTSGPGGT